MGHRTTQRILECDDCGRTPENGEYICTNCIDKEEAIPISQCCSAEMPDWPDSDLCPQCFEHTGVDD